MACLTLAAFSLSFVFNEALQAVIVRNESDALFWKSAPHRSAIPWSYGRVVNGVYCGNDLLVVYLQDLHCHPEVQKNLVSLLSEFDGRRPLTRIFAEGAPGGAGKHPSPPLDARRGRPRQNVR